nr:MBL fold metallo-hydrolase [Pseudosulfitobacter koreense]
MTDRTPRDIEMQFLGVSSFLLRDGDMRIMVDGFVSRPKAALVRSIQPDADVVGAMVERLGLATRQSCAERPVGADRLDAILAMHGHYDHALDTPLIASMTGAELIADPVVRETADRTRRLYPELCPAERGPDIRVQDVGDQQVLSYGDMTLRLIKVPHSDNPASRLLEALPKNDDWMFPTRAKNLKEGAGVAVHITTRGGNILIVPTAGHIKDTLNRPEFSAKILFLGIGGLGWGSRRDALEYFHGTIVASGARYVVPIHWDRHAPPLVAGQDGLPIPLYENLDRSLGLLQDYANKHPQFELVSVPVFTPFNPFSSLSTKERL